MALKLYVLIAEEALKAMGGNRGKLVAQGNHAALHAFWDAEARFPETAARYKDIKQGSAIKVTLVGPTVDLHAAYNAYKGICGVTSVTDKGLTVFDSPTFTAVGIGPVDLGETRMGEAQGLKLKPLI